MNAMLQEFRQALRGTLAQPGHSALIVGVLALGLSCVIFMLIVIGSLVMRPLPFPDAERLLHIGLDNGSRIHRLDPIRPGDVLSLRRHLDGVADVSAFEGATVNLSDLGRPERFDGAIVSGNFFRVLGVAPILGRDFNDADERPGAAPVTMLSNALWRSRYGADPGIVGKQVRVNARLSTVVGVMPPDFSYPRREVVWVSGTFAEGTSGDDRFAAIARPLAGNTAAQVSAGAQRWFDSISHESPTQFERSRLGIESLSQLAVHDGTRGVLDVMLVATVLVLLIACANTANLMLTRTLARRHELAVRVALGASRRRLTVHLLAQSLLLTAIAAVVAVLLARAGARWLDAAFRTFDDGPPLWMHFELDARIASMAIGVAVLTAIVAGLIPALRAGGAAMSDHLRDSGRTTGGGMGRVSRVLTMGEVALSLALLMAVGTLVRGVVLLGRSDLGIDTSQMLTARVGLFESTYPTGADQVRFFERLTAHLREDPAVVDVAAGTSLPGIDGWSPGVALDGDEIPTGQALPRINFAAVDANYLSTFDIGLLEGRGFDARDTADSNAVALVDERFAQRYGGEAGILGRRVRIDPQGDDPQLVTVVGVVANLRLDSPTDPVRPSVLVPLVQQPARFVSLGLRLRGDPAAFAPRLSALLAEVDADTPAYWVRTYDQVMREATFDTRLLAQMFAVFGIVALILAAAGLYGVIAFNVGQRTREIGVRRALGASSSSIVRSVLARSGWQLSIGVAIGLAVGFALTRALGSAMQGVFPEALDGNTVGAAGAALLTLVIAAAIASLVPARRALGVDPTVALRHE